MIKFSKRLVLVFVFVYGMFSSLSASELNVKPGMWEWTTTMEMVGMPFTPPPMVYSSCVSKDEFIPQKSDENVDCKMLKQKITRDSVEWKMECNAESGTSLSEGKIFYSGTTAKGKVTVTTQGMIMISTFSGHRTGACD